MTQMIDEADKDRKIVIALFNMTKKLGKWLRILNRVMKDGREYPTLTFIDKNYNVWNEK